MESSQIIQPVSTTHRPLPLIINLEAVRQQLWWKFSTSLQCFFVKWTGQLIWWEIVCDIIFHTKQEGGLNWPTSPRDSVISSVCWIVTISKLESRPVLHSLWTYRGPMSPRLGSWSETSWGPGGNPLGSLPVTWVSGLTGWTWPTYVVHAVWLESVEPKSRAVIVSKEVFTGANILVTATSTIFGLDVHGDELPATIARCHLMAAQQQCQCLR